MLIPIDRRCDYTIRFVGVVIIPRPAGVEREMVQRSRAQLCNGDNVVRTVL